MSEEEIAELSKKPRSIAGQALHVFKKAKEDQIKKNKRLAEQKKKAK